jgi:DNA-binding transcriptional LysR family regulator
MGLAFAPDAPEPAEDSMPIDLRQMRHVLALAEHCSFARAAVALRLSQPALSRSIQGVEREVGSELFVRSAGGVGPTDTGRLFIARAREIVRMSEDLDREVASDRSLQSGQVMIGAGPYPAQSIIAAALTRFIATYPRITARVLMREWDVLLQRLRNREIEMFVAESSTLQGEVDLEIVPLAVHPLYVAARSDHPLATHPDPTMEKVLAYPVACISRIPPRVLEPMRAAQRRSTGTATELPVFPAIEFNSLSALNEVVRGSNTVSAALLTMIAAELESGEFTLLRSEPWLHTQYAFVALKGRPLTAASSRFREFIIDADHEMTLAEQRLLADWSARAGGRAGGARRRSRRGLSASRERAAPSR